MLVSRWPSSLSSASFTKISGGYGHGHANPGNGGRFYKDRLCKTWIRHGGYADLSVPMPPDPWRIRAMRQSAVLRGEEGASRPLLDGLSGLWVCKLGSSRGLTWPTPRAQGAERVCPSACAGARVRRMNNCFTARLHFFCLCVPGEWGRLPHGCLSAPFLTAV